MVNSVAGSAEQGFTNSAFVIRPDGVDAARYDKMRLVPFGEYVPTWARTAFTDALVREVGNFTPGAEPLLLEIGLPMGMAVCYEVVFPGLITREVRDGAEILATLTNDGWYGYSWAPRQHFAHVVLRAVESRRWMARAALTGISGFVAPDGSVPQRLDVGDAGYLVTNLAVQPVTDTAHPMGRLVGAGFLGCCCAFPHCRTGEGRPHPRFFVTIAQPASAGSFIRRTHARRVDAAERYRDRAYSALAGVPLTKRPWLRS